MKFKMAMEIELDINEEFMEREGDLDFNKAVADGNITISGVGMKITDSEDGEEIDVGLEEDNLLEMFNTLLKEKAGAE